MNSQEKNGFTILEMLCTTITMVIMATAALGLLNAGNDACCVGSAYLSVQAMSTNCMVEMATRIRGARVIGIAADGHSITLQEPVDPDGDGQILDANSNIVWGAIPVPEPIEDAFGSYHDIDDDDDEEDRDGTSSAGGIAGWSFTYAYEQTGVFDERKEGMQGIDLNRDGDKRDVFAVGCIVKEFRDETGAIVSARRMTPCRIVTTILIPGGDVNNDGKPDPLFERFDNAGQADPDGQNVQISFFAFKVANKERGIFCRPTSSVALRVF